MLIMKISDLTRFLQKVRQDRAGFALTLHPGSVCCARVSLNDGKPKVINFSRQVVLDEANRSADLNKVRKALGVGREVVATLLEPGEYQLLQVDAPNVPESEIRSAVRWSVKDMLNCKIEDANLDVVYIPARNGSTEKSKSLYVVAARKDVLRKRSESFRSANLNLRVIDIPELAQRNIAALFEEAGRALAMLVLDENGSFLTFTADAELYLSRRIEIGINQLQDADEQIRQQHTERMEVEVRRSLDHFDRQYSHLAVQKLLLAAPAELGLESALSQNLGLPVQLMDLASVLDLQNVPELHQPDMQLYALQTLGLALRDKEWSA